MDKNTILNYVTETPGNTNRAVLESILDEYASEGSGMSELDSVFDKIEVTLKVDEESTDDIEFTITCVSETMEEEYSFNGFILSNGTPVVMVEGIVISPDMTVTIPIYILKGEEISLSCSSNDDVSVSTSGDIGGSNVNNLHIFGDCVVIASTGEQK